MGCLQTGPDDSSHYLSGALGVWAQGLALQIGAGGVMFFTGYKWGGLEEVKNLHEDLSLSDGWKMMEVMGMLHVVLACIVAALVLLGVFVSKCFTVFLYFVNFINSLYCLAATIGCGYFLSSGYSLANNQYEHIWDPANFGPVDTADANYQLYVMARGRLLLGAVFSLTALAPFSRASTVKPSDPTPETILYITSLILCLATGVTLTLPTAIVELIILGSIWVGLTVVVGLLNNILSCCSKNLAIGVLGVVFLCVAAYGLVTGGIIGRWYEKGRHLSLGIMSSGDLVGEDENLILAMDEEDRKYFLMYQYTDGGSYMLAAIIMGFGQFIVATFCGVYSLRFICGSSETRDQSKQY